MTCGYLVCAGYNVSTGKYLPSKGSGLSLLLSGGLPLVDIGLVLERTITTENDSALKISQQGTSQAA